MKKTILALMFCLLSATTMMASDPVSTARRYQTEAENCQRKADRYASDAESYLRQAKSYQREAEQYARSKKYDKARDYYRRAANAMDGYQDRMGMSKKAAMDAEDYLKRAANVMDQQR